MAPQYQKVLLPDEQDKLARIVGKVRVVPRHMQEEEQPDHYFLRRPQSEQEKRDQANERQRIQRSYGGPQEYIRGRDQSR